MTVILIKRLLLNRGLPWILGLVLCYGSPVLGGYLFSGSFEGRAAWHARSPQNPASDRFTLMATQSVEFSPKWSGLFGVRAWGDTVYGAHPEAYPSTLAKQDSAEFRVRDAYLQYKGDHLFLRLGNQQVVWGEAFGFLFSDIINPKDLREGGFGGASEVRMPTPILNTKLVFSKASLQVIYVGRPYFNLLPLPGSDFAYPYGVGTSFSEVQINRQQTLTITTANAEYGGKLNVLLGQLDLSAYFFYYFDRNPYYRANPQSTAQTLVLDEVHSRVDTTGMTATYDIAGSILRLEALRTFGRVLPVFNSTGVSFLIADESIAVVGIDFPTFNNNVNFGLQWSRSDLARETTGMLRSKSQNLASAHLHFSLFKSNAVDLLYSKNTLDSGEQYQMDYLIPLSSQTEMHLGAEVLAGPEISEFGRLRRASRFFITLKSFFKG